MEKLAYLLFVDEKHDGDALRDALCQEAAAKLLEAGATGVRLNVQDNAVAAGSPLRHSAPPMRAMMTFWLDSIDTRGPCETALAAHAGNIAGYLVTESSVMVPPRVAGKRTEGMNQVTCIAKRKDISDEEFRGIWHHDHKKVAIETIMFVVQ